MKLSPLLTFDLNGVLSEGWSESSSPLISASSSSFLILNTSCASARQCIESIIFLSVPFPCFFHLVHFDGANSCVQRYCRNWIGKSLLKRKFIIVVELRLVMDHVSCETTVDFRLWLIRRVAREHFLVGWSSFFAGSTLLKRGKIIFWGLPTTWRCPFRLLSFTLSVLSNCVWATFPGFHQR